MKRYYLRTRSAALFFGMALSAIVLGCASLRAQAPTGPDTSSSTTEDSTGKVTAVSATTISVTSRRGPFTYRLSPDLHVIGPDNQRLKIGDVHEGQQATVYYYLRDGEQTVARIVVIKEPGAKPGKDK